ncbi:MAG: hypothetical protein AAF824_04630, partial [Bacteroidota bacterium]
MTKTHQSKSSTATVVRGRTSAAQHVQTKMKVGSVGDKYEKEADSAAEKAVKKKKGLGDKSSLAKGISKLSSDFGKEKEKKAQKKEEKAVDIKEEAKPKVQKKEDKEEVQAKLQK